MYRKKDLYRLILRFEAGKTQEATRNLMFEMQAIEEVRATAMAKKKSKKHKKKNPELSSVSQDAAASAGDGDDFLDLQETVLASV
jgi:hypothetical protein